MIYNAVSASTIVAQGLVDENDLYFLGAIILFVVSMYFFLTVGYKIVTMPTDKTLKAISDSIDGESQKNRDAIEKLTRAVRELKHK